MPSTRLDPRDRIGGPVWRPAILTSVEAVILKGLLVVGAAVRSYDYAAGDTDRVGIIEKAMPLWAWSLACLAVSLLLLWGMSARRHLVMWFGHGWGFCVCVSLTVGTAMNALQTSPRAPDEVPPHTPTPMWWVGVAALGVMPIAIRWWQRWRLPDRPRPARWVATLGVCLAVFLSLLGITHTDLDGIRGVMPIATLAALHLMFAYRGSPRPLDGSHVHIEQVVLGPEA